MEIKGKIFKIEEPKVFKLKAGGEMRVMDFVIETEEDYPQKIVLSAKESIIDSLQDMGIGASATFKCNIKGREYEGKFFNKIECWSIGSGNSTKKAAAKPVSKEKKSDDLPF